MEALLDHEVEVEIPDHGSAAPTLVILSTHSLTAPAHRVTDYHRQLLAVVEAGFYSRELGHFLPRSVKVVQRPRCTLLSTVQHSAA